MGASTTADSETRMAVSRRDFTEVWGNQNPDAVDQIYAEGFIGHGFPFGRSLNRDQYKTLASLFHDVFPDGEMTVTEMTADDEFVHAEWTFTGTHTGSVWGIPPSGSEITFSGGGRHRHQDERVQEIWLDVKWRTLYAQLLRGYV